MDSYPAHDSNDAGQPEIEWVSASASRDDEHPVQFAAIPPGSAGQYLKEEQMAGLAERDITVDDITILCRGLGSVIFGFTKTEFAAFLDGTRKGEFNHLAGSHLLPDPETD